MEFKDSMIFTNDTEEIGTLHTRIILHLPI